MNCIIPRNTAGNYIIDHRKQLYDNQANAYEIISRTSGLLNKREFSYSG
jgi:hypothetical protein